MNIKTLAAVTAAVTGTLFAGLAQARPEVQWSVTIGAPFAPVFVAPAPVYERPAPVYVQPAPTYGRPLPMHGHYQATRWDRDGDGVPNRYDRWDNRRGARDHDGVPNRYGRQPNGPR